jgi:hypothetical protein
VIRFAKAGRENKTSSVRIVVASTVSPLLFSADHRRVSGGKPLSAI